MRTVNFKRYTVNKLSLNAANKGHEKENRKFLGGGGLYMTPLEPKFCLGRGV